MVWGPPLLAFGVTALFTWLELVTSKYPRTFFLLKRCTALYVYVLIYAVSGGLVTALFEYFGVTLEGPGVSNPWVGAVLVGISIKAFFHIRLFSVGAGPQALPIGIETVVQMFEPQLMRAIEVYQFEASKDFIGTRATKYSDLAEVKKTIRDNLPGTLPVAERTAFLSDVERATSVGNAMDLYLAFLGRRSFDRRFPP